MPMARVVMNLTVEEVERHTPSTEPALVKARRDGGELCYFPWPDRTTVPDIGTPVRVTVDVAPGD